MEIDENSFVSSNTKPAAAAVSKKGKTIEETYQKMTQLEHILLRPDTYIGSTEYTTEEMWVFDETTQGMVNRQCSYVPGLYKIFDEILVNAADNKQRDASMNLLSVDIDRQLGSISVYNNGQGIPVEMHKSEKMYVPELIFGHLLTSSNYDDSQAKTTGGRNGYGAKLTNIFSREFVVETVANGMFFRQTFQNNMSSKTAPEVKPCKAGTTDYTRITFTPDFARFKMAGLDADIVALMSRRVYDIAGCSGSSLVVKLNGNKLPVRNFKQYADLYLPSEDSLKIHEVVNDRWEVIVSVSDGRFQQVSFVNGIATTKGGTHVNLVTDQLTKHIAAFVVKKHKNAKLKPFHVRNHVFIFVRSLIVNPAFDSQTKENLISRPNTFGSACELSEKMLKAVEKSAIVSQLVDFATHQNSKELAKNDGKKTVRLNGIPKLEDANCAGGKDADKCTLILTEGDSAKSLAIAGISVVGRDHYGVFPLKGKLLNVRDAAHAQITANQEITHLKQILGLQQGKVYTDTKSLRYGHLMVMTDQDHDGSHIKGLIINLLHHYWPSLLKLPGFLTEFITPIVKATKGHDSKVFYTVPEYENWREATPKVHLWEIKYYKGLGTSTREEARHYFSNIVKHRIAFEWSGDEDGKLIDMAFNKKYADRRKQWISECKDGTFVDHTSCRLNYSDFINKELVLFSIADNKRSIPSMMDGLKPGQRKILFGCFLKNDLKSQIKVAQLSGHVSEKTAYHHGEVSLQTTIVNMAQNYVGANNLNFLEPLGQFGTRLCGGKDAASARYIFTRLSPIVRSMFPKVDDALLTYLDDDGLSVEPEFYAPILPTVLLNGASGIGTGWSTTVLQYNPRDICTALKSIMQGFEPAEIHPWYRGFTGTVAAKFAGRAQVFDGYSIDGCIEEVGPTTVRVTELPIETWTQTYKDWLETLLAEGKIKDYKNYSTDTTVDFVIELPSTAAMDEAKATGLKKKFRLSAMVATSNMVLFDDENKLQRYASVSDIIKDFYRVRAPLYEKRKQHLVDNLRSELIKLENQVRFIEDVCAGRLKVANKKKSELFQEMSAKGFVALVNNKKNDDEEADVVVGEKGFDYLLSMPIYSLTQEKVNAFQASMRSKSTELDALLQTTPQQLWARDLDAFEVALDTFEEELRQVEERGNQGGKSKRGGAKSKYVDSDDDNAFDDDEDDEDFGAKKKKPAKKAAAKKELAPAPQNNTKHLNALSSRVQHSESNTERKALQMVVQKSTGAAIKETKTDSKPVEEEIEFEELSLFERLQRRNASVAAVGGLMKEKKETKKKLPAKAQKVSDDVFDTMMGDDDEVESDGGEVVAPIAVNRPARATAKKVYVESEDEEEEDDFEGEEDDEEEEDGSDDEEAEDFEESFIESEPEDDEAFEEESPVKPIKKVAAPIAKKPIVVESDDDVDEFEFDAPIKVADKGQKRGVAKKPVDSVASLTSSLSALSVRPAAPSKPVVESVKPAVVSAKPVSAPVSAPAPVAKPMAMLASPSPQPKRRRLQKARVDDSDEEQDEEEDFSEPADSDASESDFDDDDKPKKKAAPKKAAAVKAPKPVKLATVPEKAPVVKKAAAPKEKAPPKEKAAPKPKVVKETVPKKAAAKKQKDSDDESDVAEFDVAPRARPARATVKKSYAYSDDEDDDEDFEDDD